MNKTNFNFLSCNPKIFMESNNFVLQKYLKIVITIFTLIWTGFNLFLMNYSFINLGSIYLLQKIFFFISQTK